MNKKVCIIFGFLLFIIFSSGVKAELQIIMNDSFSASHNSILELPLLVNNTGNNISISMTITNITNSSQILPVEINESKKIILANSSENYTIKYPLPKYILPATYPLTINVFGNETETNNTFFINKTISVIIKEEASIATDPSSLTIFAYPSLAVSGSFVLKNTGNSNLTNISFTQESKLVDDDNDTITLEITSDKNLSLLLPGEHATIYVKAIVSQKQDINSYTTILAINSSSASTSLQLVVVVSETFCEKGEKGNLGVEIKNYETSYYSSEEIKIQAKVRNYGEEKDVIVEAALFDKEKKEFFKSTEEHATINKNSYEFFYPRIYVPADIKEGKYKLYVKAYEDGNEEEQCAQKWVEIEIKRKTHDIEIEKVQLPDEFACGILQEIAVTISNFGKKDEDVKLQLSVVGISEEKKFFLEKGESRKIVFDIILPQNTTAKNYTLTLKAYYNFFEEEWKDYKTKLAVLKARENCFVEEAKAVVNVEVGQAYKKEQFVARITIFNTGDAKATFRIAASGYENWASLDKIEPSITELVPKETSLVNIYLTPFEEGTKSFVAKIIYDNKIVEKSISVDVKEKITVPGLYSRIVQKLSSFSGLDLTTVNIVLVIAILLLIVWIARVRRRY